MKNFTLWAALLLTLVVCRPASAQEIDLQRTNYQATSSTGGILPQRATLRILFGSSMSCVDVSSIRTDCTVTIAAAGVTTFNTRAGAVTLTGSDVTTALPAVTQTIATGTASLGTGSISSGACATVVTASATGVAATDVIAWTPNASIAAVTGYAPATAGGLSIVAYPTANNVNFDVCNWSTGSITPGAVTLNWKVVR